MGCPSSRGHTGSTTRQLRDQSQPTEPHLTPPAPETPLQGACQTARVGFTLQDRACHNSGPHLELLGQPSGSRALGGHPCPPPTSKAGPACQQQAAWARVAGAVSQQGQPGLATVNEIPRWLREWGGQAGCAHLLSWASGTSWCHGPGIPLLSASAIAQRKARGGWWLHAGPLVHGLGAGP